MAKTSSCRIYANSRREILQLGSFLGSVFLLFPMKVAGAHAHSNREKSLPPALSDSPASLSLFNTTTLPHRPAKIPSTYTSKQSFSSLLHCYRKFHLGSTSFFLRLFKNVLFTSYLSYCNEERTFFCLLFLTPNLSYCSLLTSLLSVPVSGRLLEQAKAQFKRRISQVPNLMQMSENN